MRWQRAAGLRGAAARPDARRRAPVLSPDVRLVVHFPGRSPREQRAARDAVGVAARRAGVRIVEQTSAVGIVARAVA
jgi:hypothetical protein